MKPRKEYIVKYWTEDEDEYLLENYPILEQTAAKIAKHLKRPRNSIIGRWVKIRPDRAAHPKHKPMARIKSVRLPNPVVVSEPVPVVVKPSGKGLLELKSTECHYITGKDTYCGDRILKRSYCEHHYAICYKRSPIKIRTPSIEYKSKTNGIK